MPSRFQKVGKIEPVHREGRSRYGHTYFWIWDRLDQGQGQQRSPPPLTTLLYHSLQVVSPQLPFSLSLCTFLDGFLGFGHLLPMNHALLSTPDPVLQTAPSSWKLCLIMSLPRSRSFTGFLMSAKKGWKALHTLLHPALPTSMHLCFCMRASLSLQCHLLLSIRQTPIFPLRPSPKISLHHEAFLNSPGIPWFLLP